ncbi:uncharacterized protein DS421_3g82600 [Arachis hypogaea]|nr:uncharacterized protein DS421_3g82600 [Arachis hypogaea]
MHIDYCTGYKIEEQGRVRRIIGTISGIQKCWRKITSRELLTSFLKLALKSLILSSCCNIS